MDYQSGFGNTFSSEALPNTLPLGQNSPQQVAHGLYAEQITGSAFTAPRSHNLRSWLYRIRPSAVHGEFQPIKQGMLEGPPISLPATPNPLRWDPLPEAKPNTDFIAGLHTFLAQGSPANQQGAAVHLYACNASMAKRFFYNADAELLLIPQAGKLTLETEMGTLAIGAGDIAVIPRGIKFQVVLEEATARGYVCENFGAPFELPGLGPIGANGLANPRDFQYPVARFHDSKGDFELLCKFQGKLYSAPLSAHPLDVVAWHGNYAPYRYNLNDFNTLGSISYDHPDPSIFTVLTSQTATPGTANCDFVIFPERWMVAENTFRLPYYHRNLMSEYMGLITGQYDAKDGGFTPGGGSLHNCMSAHGPDKKAFDSGTKAALKPERYENTLAFMLESFLPWQPTAFAMTGGLLQADYQQCWQSLESQFKA